MERNVIISLIAGYLAALLPVWNWDSRIELATATAMFCIICLMTLIWVQDLAQKIKKALTSANVRAIK